MTMIEDAIWAAILLWATLGVAWANMRNASKAFPEDSPLQLILHASVATITICTVSVMLVGSLSLISPTAVLAGAVCLSLASRAARFYPSTVNRVSEDCRSSALLSWGVIASIIAGHSIADGLLRFPDDFDCLMYHMPLIDQWLQTGSLAATRITRWSDPANGELWGMWFAAPFSGDFLVGIANVPVVIVWATGLLELGVQLGLSGRLRHAAAIASLAVYTTVHETDDLSNDLMVVAFFVSGAAYALRFWRSSAASDLALFGMSLGMLAGTKFLAIGYAVLLGLLFILLSVQRSDLRKGVAAQCIAFAISLIVGGYWYLRNFAITGFPFFPQGSIALHERIVHPDILRTTLALNGDSLVPALAFDAVWRMCGPIHFLVVIAFPTIVLAVLLARVIFPAASVEKRRQMRLALVIALLSLAITLITPMLVEDQPGTLNHLRWGYTPIRYSLCFLCASVMLAAVLIQALLQSLRSHTVIWIGVVLEACAVVQVIYRFVGRSELTLLVNAIVGAAVLLLLVAIARWLRRGRWCKIGGAAMLSLAASASVSLLSERWHDGYAGHFDRFYEAHVFRELNRSEPRAILVLDERPYAFFGSRRQNLVIQPAVFSGSDSVDWIMRRHGLDLVVTRIDTHKPLSRYRPAWEELEVDRRFELVGWGAQLRIFANRR